jgi:hypothetical protein
MKIRTLVLVATAASVTLLVPAAHGFTAAGPLTTEPDVYTNVDVTITDSKITLSQNDFDRGDGVDFRVRNIGKKVHSFALVAEGAQVISLDAAGLKTPMLKPHQSSVISVYMDLRGTYGYRSLAKLDRAKPRMHGKFVVN